MKKSLIFILSIIFTIALCSQVKARVTGACSNCHTMHYSQGGASMATYGGFGEAPFQCLVRGNCLGCHGQSATGGEYATWGSQKIPQVYHATGGTDLAAGNFKYIDTSDAKGHNIDLLGNTEDTIPNVASSFPPGDEHGNYTAYLTKGTFTCAGKFGCHGDRDVEGNFESIKGAHHGGVSGECDGSDLANSYRFLKGVKGHENTHNTYPWQNRNSTIHNEYYGASGTGTESTASTPGGNTISGLCAECHGNFHQGADVTAQSKLNSPWLRHPTDIVLTNSGEYTSYTTYSILAPVARPSLYGTINNLGTNNVVTPGTDIIMCLSCHGVHATNYYKLMRWEYDSTSLATALEGCNVCHTSKN
ncbi:MAG: hypothetical protein LWW97_00665 [Deltaproteobacteria bacterium]|nr:hypothetical protein [Deltaproteobacteria bacterium]